MSIRCSLYALLHGIQRTIETIFSSSTVDADDSTFKLFGKFDIRNLRAELQNSNDAEQQSTQDNNQMVTSNIPNNRFGSDGERDLVEWQTILSLVGCLLFSLFSGLLAGLFAIEHLINIVSIGTLLMLYAITIDIIILR